MNQERVGNEQQVYFYDTYALYSIALGRENYAKFSKGYRIVTTIMNLYELYYNLIKEGEYKLAEEFVNRLISSCIEITSEDIKHASKFRLENTKKDISFIDALGYAIALNLDIKFLTGDEQFRNFKNVEFVKE
ncbi:PIN domain-containing protein [Candidatus Woesearchaeota archaeon]|nr:PIN domain-containing protein [Candidatus Woesearchaeota archaeon]